MSAPPLPDGLRPVFRALVRGVVPAAEDLDADGWAAVHRIVDAALAQRAARVQRQIALFLRIVSILAVLRHWRRLASLPTARSRRFLRSLERSPLLLLRRGFWGLRTLALMGYYARPEARGELGYAAAASGWEGRGGLQGAWAARGDAGAAEPRVLTVDGLEAPDA